MGRVHKPLHPPRNLGHRSTNHTYLVIYKIHVVNESLDETDQGQPAENLIHEALDEMAGLHVFGTVVGGGSARILI